MDFKRIYDDGLAMATYIVGCPGSGEAVVIDPPRDFDQVLDEVKALGLEVAGVAETHIHADFLSGARDMAHHLQVPFYHSADTVAGWEYAESTEIETRGLHHESTIKVGNIRLVALHTPGHTPEHMSFLIEDGGHPRMLLSGDFVFVGDVGRPDLLDTTGSETGTSRDMAGDLFESLKHVFLQLSDDIIVWPGHGAGSACGKSMSALPCTTVGFERRHAWWSDYLASDDREGFIERLLDGQPETPRYFARMKQLNRDGAPRRNGPPSPPELYPRAARTLIDRQALLIDTRAQGTHDIVKGSVRFRNFKKLSDHAGRLLEPAESVLVIDTPERARHAARKLERVGIGPVTGFITSHPDTYDLDVIDAKVAHQLHESEQASFLDVRSKTEFEQGHIPQAAHIPFGELVERHRELAQDRTWVVYCASGVRATLAATYLQSQGHEHIKIFEPGFGAW